MTATTLAPKTRSIRPANCDTCRRPMVSSGHKGPVPDGHARHRAGPLCHACWQRAQRTTRPKAPAPTPQRVTGPALNPGDEYVLGTYLSTRPQVPEDTARAAALQACGWARDTDDARQLLTALGLIDRPGEAA